MTLTIHLFARFRELAGADSLTAELHSDATVAELRAWLTEHHPAWAELLHVTAIAVNHDLADSTRVLVEHDEIALIPPVSGGGHISHKLTP